MTDTASDMLIKSALAEIEQLKAQLATEKNIVNQVCQEVYDLEAKLREVEAERDDTGFRLRLYEVAYEDAVTAIRKLSEDMATAHTAPVVEPTPEPGFDYWYDHANGRYQRY